MSMTCSVQVCLSLNIINVLPAQDNSESSSQPDIVTVRETIVTVSAQNSASPSSSISDPVPMATQPVETIHSAALRLRDDRGSVEDKHSSLGNFIPVHVYCSILYYLLQGCGNPVPNLASTGIMNKKYIKIKTNLQCNVKILSIVKLILKQ